MQRTSSVPARIIAFVMALCPVSLATLVHTGIRPVPLAIESPQLPALAFHQYAVDLRKIHPTTEAQASFVFQNRGPEDVRIISLEPSCGCLTPVLQGDRDKVIAANESARIVMRMQPANSTPGPHEYTVKVSYTDPQLREVTLSLKLDIPETTLTVTPPALIVFHPAGSAPTVTDFVVTDGRGKRFELTDVSINTDLVEAVIGESGMNAKGHFQQSVRVSIAGALPPGKARVLLRIATNDLEVPELRIPLILEGPHPEKAVERDPALDHEHQ